jgi:pyruvate-formate lyase-activating enzyme
MLRIPRFAKEPVQRKIRFHFDHLRNLFGPKRQRVRPRALSERVNGIVRERVSRADTVMNRQAHQRELSVR